MMQGELRIARNVILERCKISIWAGSLIIGTALVRVGKTKSIM